MKARLTRVMLGTLSLLGALNVGNALAADQSSMAVDLRRIELEWAHITYQLPSSDEQDRQMRALATQAAQLVARYPGRPEPLIWDGIVTSSEAKYAGSFSAMGFAKDARDLFEKAGRIDYRAVDGSVPISLGALYYLVPGFPLGFGDNDKARKYLEQGIQMNPNGLDANYFYADFLYRQGEYEKSATVLKHGLSVPADPQRPVWDAGRRSEMRALLSKVNQRLASGG